MKKVLLSLLLIAVIVSLSFADTANASMEVSAYKDPPMPELSYTIKLKYLNSTEITGITSSFDISESIKSSRTLSNAFVVEIQTNKTADINISLEFSPFVNQSNKTDMIAAEYDFTKNVTQKQGSTTYRNGNTSYYYRYTPAFILKNSNGSSITSISASTSNVTATLLHSFNTSNGASVQQKKSTRNTWSNTTLITSTSTLAGFSSTDLVTSYAYFALSISDLDYASMESNTDYVATVTATITTI